MENQKKSQKQIIIEYLRWKKENAKSEDEEWEREHKLRSTNTHFGWLGFQADRRCRELHNEGILERRLNGKYAEYRLREKVIPVVQIEVSKEPGRLFELPPIVSM